jgi:hypothetical protein
MTSARASQAEAAVENGQAEDRKEETQKTQNRYVVRAADCYGRARLDSRTPSDHGGHRRVGGTRSRIRGRRRRGCRARMSFAGLVLAVVHRAELNALQFSFLAQSKYGGQPIAFGERRRAESRR